MKKLEAAYHKFQRSLLGTSRRDRIRNDTVSERNDLRLLGLIITERILR